MNWKTSAGAGLIALGVISAAALAQQPPATPSPPRGGMMQPGMGPGMMHGHGWHRDDDASGCGMYGRGSPGMAPGMMGPGMMGHGMMSHGMNGLGMMGLGPLHRLDLNDTQRQQLLKLDDELRRRNWDVMGKMQDEMAKVRDAMSSAKRDRAVILAASKRMSELRQQALENSLDVYDKAEALLTPQQRDELRRYGW